MIHKSIDSGQLLNPVFFAGAAAVFVLTVLFSAAYPAFYLSRFSPLDVLSRRLKFSRQRLSTVIMVFQSVVSIVLLSLIIVVNRQAAHLRKIPLGYEPQNVVAVSATNPIKERYFPLREALLSNPDIVAVSGGDHVIGGGVSGQGIGLPNSERTHSVNAYRVMPGLPELMNIDLLEGLFFKEESSKAVVPIILNESAVRLLGLEYPVVGQYVAFSGEAEVVGIVRDFMYDFPGGAIQPLMIHLVWESTPRFIYVKVPDRINRAAAERMITDIFRRFDPDFIMNAVWVEDVYREKFDNIRMQSKVIFMGSLISMLLAMMGLAAGHLYNTVRRTKEIGIRRVNGATAGEIFSMLSSHLLKWVFVAGVIAAPITWVAASRWLLGFTDHITVGWWILALPVLAIATISVLVTSGVSLRVASRNPVNSLKSE